MLMIRLQRIGRKNEAHFRMVVLPKHKGPKTQKYVDIVGSYNPKLGRVQVDADKIKKWLENGAQPSDTVRNMLITEGIMEGRKVNVLPKKRPTKKRNAPEEEEVKEEAPKAEAEPDAETPTEEAPAEEPTPEAEAPAEETTPEQSEEPAAEEEKTEEAAPEAEEVKEEAEAEPETTEEAPAEEAKEEKAAE